MYNKFVCDKKEIDFMFPPIIEFLKDKKVLILGFGREGKSTYNYSEY